MLNTIVIDINIAADEYLKLYRGQARDVLVTSRDGRTVRFPARILQPFVTREGIRGSFRVSFDQKLKFQSIDRL